MIAKVDRRQLLFLVALMKEHWLVSQGNSNLIHGLADTEYH